jgi:hypothetical protein
MRCLYKRIPSNPNPTSLSPSSPASPSLPQPPACASLSPSPAPDTPCAPCTTTDPGRRRRRLPPLPTRPGGSTRCRCSRGQIRPRSVATGPQGVARLATKGRCGRPRRAARSAPKGLGDNARVGEVEEGVQAQPWRRDGGASRRGGGRRPGRLICRC